MTAPEIEAEAFDRDIRIETSLTRLLNSPMEIGVVLPLTTCLDELIPSLIHARSNTWRREQRRSLLGDMEAAVGIMGSEVRSAVGLILAETLALAGRVLNVKKAHEHPEFNALLAAAETLAECLREPEIRCASWRDVVSGLRKQLPVHVIDDRVRLLLALQSSAKRDADDDRRGLCSIIERGMIAALGAREGDSPSTSARLLSCEALIAQPATTSHCVAWVALAGTRLPKFVVPAGPVTFFEAEWAVPNAQREQGQDFLYRDELRELANESFSGIPFESGEVLVRVDLGQRPVAGALDEGWRWATFVAGFATLSARTRAWPKRGWNVLQTDDVWHYGWFATDDLEDHPTSARIERVARELERISVAMIAKPDSLSPNLIEAVDSAIEARGTEIRSRNILRFRVLEMVAAHAGVAEVDDLLALMKGQWAHDGIGHRVVSAVHVTLLGHAVDPALGGLNERLRNLILTHQATGGVLVDMPAVAENAGGLLSLVRSEYERQALRADLDAVRVAALCAEYLSRLEGEEVLLYSRLRRVRNALTHGNPITHDAASSVDNYLMYLTEFALEKAIAAPGTEPLVAAFEKIQVERAETRNRLAAGEDPLAVLNLLPKTEAPNNGDEESGKEPDAQKGVVQP
jgi:hypothetical protein